MIQRNNDAGVDIPSRPQEDEAARTAACEHLLARLRNRYRSVMKIPADKEDVAQDSVVALLAAKKAPRTSWGQYLNGITKNKQLVQFKQSRRRQDLEMRLWIERQGESREGQNDIEYQESLAILTRDVRYALAQLPPKLREAVELCEQDGLTCREAAEQLGRNESTVSDHLQKGRSRLRSILESMGYSAFVLGLLDQFAEEATAASVLSAIAKPTAAVPEPGTTLVDAAMKIGGAIVSGTWRAVRTFAANKSHFACGLVVFLACYLQLLPASEALPPQYLVNKFDPATPLSELEELKCIYVAKEVFDAQGVPVTAAEDSEVIMVFGLQTVPEGEGGMRLFVRSISDDRRQMLRRNGSRNVEGEVILVSPEDEKTLLKEMARRACDRSSSSCWDLPSLYQIVIRAVFGCD